MNSLASESLTISSAPEDRPAVGERRGAEGPEEREAPFSSPRMGADDPELADIDGKDEDERDRGIEVLRGVGEGTVPSCDEMNTQSKPNVTPDVEHVDRCIPVLEEWQQLIDRRVRGGAMRCTVALSLSPVMTQQ